MGLFHAYALLLFLASDVDYSSV